MKVVLLAGRGPMSFAVAHALAEQFELRAVICERPPSRMRLVRRRAAKLGWLAVFDQLAFQTVGVLALRLEARRRLKELLSSDEFRHDSFGSAPVFEVNSVNDEEVRGLIERHSPDVVVVNGTRIISRALLETIKVPVINTHLGITPTFRGVHGGYWALAEGKPELFGATVHLVDTGIDTGKVLAQATANPSARDNFVTYPFIQLKAVLCDLVSVVAAKGGALSEPITAESSSLRYHPRLTGYVFRRLLRGTR